MNRYTFLAVASLAVSGCAGMGRNNVDAAAGPDPATSAAMSFTQADLNGDARIDRREFDSWRARSDDNAAGARAAAGGSAASDAFDAADTNFNGVLTLDEWRAMLTSGRPRPESTR